MTSRTARARRPAASALVRSGLLLFALAALPAWADETVRVDPLAGGLPPEKAASLAEGRVVLAPDIPGRVLPPRPEALGCATPTTFGVVQATHPFYDVGLDASNGSFTARTGASHSVTALAAGLPQNVIFGGSTMSPGTSDAAWRFHDQALTYSDPTGGSACTFDPPDTLMEPASVGVEQEWTVTPAAGITCTLRQEIVAFGTTEANSGVRLTLSTTNLASSASAVNVGIRWQIDYQNTSDDGPLYAQVTCDPPSVGREWSTEHEMLPAEILDFYRIQNNAGFPIFSNVTSTTSISGVPDTSRPDRLVYGRWGQMVNSIWDYAAVEGGCCPDSDSAVLWYHGYLPADGDVLAPGESSRHTIVIFSSADSVDCGTFVPGCATAVVNPPQDQRICAGGSATLDGSGVTISDCTGTVDYTWSDGTSTWSGPTQTFSPPITTDYSLAVTCSTDPTCRADFNMRVSVDVPPEFRPPLALDQDECNNGIKVSWNDAVFHGGMGGHFNLYRSEISCADALMQPPIATGLLTPGYQDRGTQSGHTYYYVVEAEDAVPGSTCSPVGPGGGSAVQLCSSTTDDMRDDEVPAGAGAVLFASHVGDQITLRWTGLRALLPGEHAHLLKAWLDPQYSFVRVNPEGDLGTSFTETDTSAWLQFFDLRVANACERQSQPDYPPGW